MAEYSPPVSRVPPLDQAPGPAGEPPLASPCPRLDLRVSFLASLHGVLRSAAGDENVNRAASPALGRGIHIYQRLQNSFPVARGAGAAPGSAGLRGPANRSAATWHLLDALVYGAPDLDALARRAADLPPVLAGGLESGPTLALLREALEAASPAYAAGAWAGGEALVRNRLAWWDERVAPVLPRMLVAASGALALEGVCPEVPVFLVPATPGPGAATYRGPSGAFVVAGVDKLPGLDLAEAVLHEALHALEAAAGDGDSIPARLRTELERRGADPFTVQQLPHAILFVLAAQTVRDHLDPHHQPLGRSHGAYDRGLAPYLGVLEPAIARVAAGHLPPENLIPLLVSAFASAQAP